MNQFYTPTHIYCSINTQETHQLRHRCITWSRPRKKSPKCLLWKQLYMFVLPQQWTNASRWFNPAPHNKPTTFPVRVQIKPKPEQSPSDQAGSAVERPRYCCVTCDECKRADREVMAKKEEALWVRSSLAYIRLRCHRQREFGGCWQQKIYWFSIHLLGFKCAELWQSSWSKK